MSAHKRRFFVNTLFSLCSGEAASADVQQPVPLDDGVRREGVPRGGARSVLPVVRHSVGDERAVPVRPLHRVRGHAERDEPRAHVQPDGARGLGWSVRRHGRRPHHAARCRQDAAQYSGERCSSHPLTSDFTLDSTLQEEGALKQAHQKQVNGFFNAAKLVYQLGGVRGFFQVID